MTTVADIGTAILPAARSSICQISLIEQLIGFFTERLQTSYPSVKPFALLPYLGQSNPLGYIQAVHYFSDMSVSPF